MKYSYLCVICNISLETTNKNDIEQFLINHFHNRHEIVVQDDSTGKSTQFLGNFSLKCKFCRLNLETTTLKPEDIRFWEDHECDEMITEADLEIEEEKIDPRDYLNK